MTGMAVTKMIHGSILAIAGRSSYALGSPTSPGLPGKKQREKNCLKPINPKYATDEEKYPKIPAFCLKCKAMRSKLQVR